MVFVLLRYTYIIYILSSKHVVYIDLMELFLAYSVIHAFSAVATDQTDKKRIVCRPGVTVMVDWA